jgi:hypothetical protein
MPRLTTEQRLANVHAQALQEFNTIQAAVKDERLQCLKDRRFYSIPGAQWEGDLGAQFDNKPRFEVNKAHLAVIRIINEYRNNRISVDFASKEGLEEDQLADTCDGMFRADEDESTAEEAYDNAFEESVGGGIGAWRLRNEYEDEEDPNSDEQKICIEPIFDADSSVFFDLQAKRQDKADAKHCFVLTSMTRSDYEAEYDDDPQTWGKVITQSYFDWSTPDVVYVAEYYKIIEKKKLIHIYEMLDGSEQRIPDDELDDEKAEHLAAIGAKEIGTKKIRQKRVHKYILSGGGVLEDCGLIAGPNIPIIVTYGKRWYVDNVERCMGHVRLVKDVARLKNMQISKLGEISAMSSVEKPILTPEQVAGHEGMWSEDNLKNWPYLLVNPITDAEGKETIAGPVAYTRAPAIPPAMAALLQITEQDIQDLLGNQRDGEQLQAGISTETAHLIQNKLDMQTFIYMSNFAKAMQRCGEVWLGMAKEVYVEKNRKKKVVDVEGASSFVTLQEPGLDKDGKTELKNDLSKAKMDVSVEVGPASSTKRAATVRALTNQLKITTDPETIQVLNALIMMNMEGEGVGEVRRYFRKKLLKIGVIEPNEQEATDMAEELANQPPSAQDEYLKAAADEATASAGQKQADILKKQAETDKTRAQTQEILSKISIEEIEKYLEVVKSLGEQVDVPSAPGEVIPPEPLPTNLPGTEQQLPVPGQ